MFFKCLHTGFNMFINSPFLSIASIQKGIYLALIAMIPVSVLQSQSILPKHHMYGCENCQFTDIAIVGKHTVLIYSDNLDHKNRKIVLLDESYLLLDEIPASTPLNILVLDDSTFSVQEYDYPVQFKIRHGKLINSKTVFVKAKAQDQMGLRHPWTDGDALFGRKLKNGKTLHYRLPFVRIGEVKAWLPLNQPIDYLKSYRMWKDTVLLIEGNKKNVKAIPDLLIAENQVLVKRGTSYGSAEYAVAGDRLMIFNNNSQQLFVLDNISFNVLARMDLPIAGNGDGWAYFYDKKNQAHYGVFLQEGKEQHTLYRLFPFSDEKMNVGTLFFYPSLIHDKMVYRVVRNDNAADILRYPLDPGFQIEESIYINEVTVNPGN